METRRIRRRERQRSRRFHLLALAVALAGVAMGTSLPRNRIATIVLLLAAVGALVLVAIGDDSTAPLHGLHRVVRLPLRAAIGASVASYRSRVAGSARALAARLNPVPTPLVLDEPDDESEAWWGVPPPPEPPIVAVRHPVVAAPLSSAHVPVGPAR